jgi:hypothetical protein
MEMVNLFYVCKFLFGEMEVKLDFILLYELDSIAIGALLVHMELCHPKVHALLFPLMCNAFILFLPSHLSLC